MLNMASGITFMQRRKGSGIYEFRKRLPNELAGKPAPSWLKTHKDISILINPKTGHFKRELTVSLGTNDPKLAKRRDLTEAKKAHDLLDLAAELMAKGPQVAASEPSIMPSPDELRLGVIRNVLLEDETEREQGDARRHHQTRQERAQWPDLLDAKVGQFGLADGHHEVMGEEIGLLKEDFDEAFKARDIGIVKPELNAYLRKNNIQIAPSSLEYHRAGMAILQGYKEAYALLEKKQQGDIVPTPEPAPSKGPKLSEALKHWQKGGSARGAKRPSVNSSNEAERAVRYFKEWHGDLKLGDITKALVRDFRDNGLCKIPTRLSHKQRAYKLRKLVTLSPGKTGNYIHASTINKSLNLLGAIINVCERDGLLDELPAFANPFSHMQLRIDDRNASTSRKPFSPSQLNLLFGDGVFTEGQRPLAGGGEACYWLPLLALLTGARLNELAHLLLADIAPDPESGIWFINIDSDGDKSIKTASSRRVVPLHEELVRLGILTYRESLMARKGAKETDRLFPELKLSKHNGEATAFTKWFGRYKRETIGIDDSSVVFHSFRHTFKRLCRDAGLSEELHDALTGHTSASVGRGYGDGFGLKALHEGVNMIPVPDSVKALPEWKPGVKPAQKTTKRRYWRDEE